MDIMYAFFIRRPIVAICLALIILLSGIFSAIRLPVSQYPDIVPPQISISTIYPGADCFTVVDSVASPMEQQMSGVEGMDYMTSTSTNSGAMVLNVVFEEGSSTNMDQVLAYLRYAQSSSQLPDEVQKMGIEMHTQTGIPMLLYALESPKGEYDPIWLSNYVNINLLNPLLRTKGVGNVDVFGAGDYAMRIWLRPDRMAALGISVLQISQAIKSQNRVNPVGEMGAEPAVDGQTRSYTLRTQGRLTSVADFENVIVRANSEAIVKLSEVARVELGSKNYNISALYNGTKCAIIAIYQTPGSNALDTVAAIEATLKGHHMPPGIELTQVLNTTESVSLGIKEIIITLCIALSLVMLVVFVFLQGWRAALIPLSAVPVSIVGTFVFFPIFGMEINTICLMGMVLAIGLVVDDAIVVVEAVQTRLDKGMNAQDATRAAMREVAGPIVATALVLAAVFFPSMLLPGISGKLFAQFALTIGVSIVISAFTALSLSPALAALLLRPKNLEKKGVFVTAGNGFNRAFSCVRRFYVSVAGWMIHRGLLTGLLLLIAVFCIYPVAKQVPSDFLPNEDEGYYFATLQLPFGVSREVTEQASIKIEKKILENDAVRRVITVNGFNMMTKVQSSNNAYFFIVLKDWSQRNPKTQNAKLLCNETRMMINQMDTGGIFFSMTPPAIPALGASSDVSMMLEDRTGNEKGFLARQTEIFMAMAQKRPEILMLMNFMAEDTPQYYLDLDVEKALTQGVDVEEAYASLQCYLGSMFVDYFNRFGYQWQVYMQAEASARMSPDGLKDLYLTGKNGVQIPLSSLVKLERSSGPYFLIRQNMYNSSMLDVVATPGYTSAQVMSALEEVFAESMPREIGYSYTGMSYQQKKAQTGMSLTMLFAISGLFAYLLLASLYESWLLPISVMLSMPVTILGAMTTLYLADQALNIYTEIGLIMLIGLSAKNAILVVEFAQNRLAEGASILHATLMAARERLRPILMTSLAFILGCIPLVIASGPGAAARQAVGICVVGGMFVVSFIGVFFNPFAYYIIARLRERLAKKV